MPVKLREWDGKLFMNFDNMKANNLINIVTKVTEAMQAVLTQRADELARETGFVKRQRRLSGSQFVQALVFGWLADSDARLETLSQSARNVSVEISRQGLHQRFTAEAAAFLKAVLYESIDQAIQANPVCLSLLNRFAGVYVSDSTMLVLPDVLADLWPGCEGSALKISVCWELVSGQLFSIHLHPAVEHDQQAP